MHSLSGPELHSPWKTEQLLTARPQHQAVGLLLLPESAVHGLGTSAHDRQPGYCGPVVQRLGGKGAAAFPQSLSDLPGNMHEKLICKDSVKSKCFDEED